MDTELHVDLQAGHAAERPVAGASAELLSSVRLLSEGSIAANRRRAEAISRLRDLAHHSSETAAAVRDLLTVLNLED